MSQDGASKGGRTGAERLGRLTSLFFSAGLWLAGASALWWLTGQEELWVYALTAILPPGTVLAYPGPSLRELFVDHLLLVGLATGGASLGGITLGLVVSRPRFRALRPLVESLGAFAQTVPPLAVLALSVPLLGYGNQAAVVALVLYCVLPVLAGTLGGLDAIQPEVVEAARGCGMGPWQVLGRIELPLAAPSLVAGMRTCAGLCIGTAMIGATVGGGGLGRVLTAGLNRDNPAFVLQGLLPALALAVLVDSALGAVERGLRVPGSGLPADARDGKI